MVTLKQVEELQHFATHENHVVTPYSKEELLTSSIDTGVLKGLHQSHGKVAITVDAGLPH